MKTKPSPEPQTHSLCADCGDPMMPGKTQLAFVLITIACALAGGGCGYWVARLSGIGDTPTTVCVALGVVVGLVGSAVTIMHKSRSRDGRQWCFCNHFGDM